MAQNHTDDRSAIVLPDLTPDQQAYLRRKFESMDKFDPSTVIGGPEATNLKIPSTLIPMLRLRWKDGVLQMAHSDTGRRHVFWIHIPTVGCDAPDIREIRDWIADGRVGIPRQDG